MMFGGDADTIMSMTGAIAGAYFGESGIPDYMKRISEGVDNAMRQADQLHKLVTQWFHNIFKICDLSIALTKTKYIKLSTKTQNFF